MVPVPVSALEAVAAQSLPLLGNMNAAVGMIGAAAGLSAPGAVVNVAGRQRMLSQKMAKEALLIGLYQERGVAQSSVDAMLGTLTKSRNLFVNSHNALVHGNSDETLGFPSPPQLEPLTDVCIKRQLEEDVYQTVWGAMEPAIAGILNTKIASQDRLQLIADNNIPLLKFSNAAVTMFISQAKIGVACTAAPPQGWHP
jgi:hypothetical protein